MSAVRAGLLSFALGCLAAAGPACGHDWSSGSDGTDVADEASTDAEALPDARDDGAAEAGPDGEANLPDDASPQDADGDAPGELPSDDAGETLDDSAPPDLPLPPICGNAVVQAGEECDDGNRTNDDGCQTDCTFSCHSGAECRDDGNVCTTETCAAAGTGQACVHELNSDPCDDGDRCTGDDHCDGGRCTAGTVATTWYMDADLDGYGDPSTGSCSDPRPPDWSDNDLDCCDSLAEVNPGQTAWFDAPYDCGDGDQWDYDCDGTEEPRWTACLVCTTETPCAMLSGPGWSSFTGGCSVPPCGVSAMWGDDCTGFPPLCWPVLPSTTMQECR